MQEYEFNQLAKDFDRLVKAFSDLKPKAYPEYKPTYLELCQYPGNRFEEICSRIFEFYFNPSGGHGLSDLFLRSFVDCLPESERSNNLVYESSILEDATEHQKRIDITLVLRDRVICIENKIFASLYNDLDEYKNHIDQKYAHKGIKHLVVLSLKELDTNEKDKCQKNGFLNIRYQDFFEKIKINLGSYIQDCDQRYLAYLLDFMKTIQNKGCFMSDIKDLCDSENYKFYCKNEREFNQLTRFADDVRKEIQEKQNAQISVLHDFQVYAKSKTSARVPCWTEGATPCIMHYKKDSNLGVEFAFGISENSPCGKIRFVITEWRNWGKNAWEKSKEKIMAAFPDGEFKESVQKKQYFIDYDISIKDGVIENRDELAEKLVEIDKLL